MCDLMEAGHWRLAEAHVHLLLAAGEQAAIQSWEWPLAWLLTQLPKPPFPRIRTAPVTDTARPLSRLADQALLSAVFSFYRDVNTVMEASRKAAPTRPPRADGGPPPKPPKGGGGGKGAPTPPAEGL